jgi:hypothetical protein
MDSQTKSHLSWKYICPFYTRINSPKKSFNPILFVSVDFCCCSFFYCVLLLSYCLLCSAVSNAKLFFYFRERIQIFAQHEFMISHFLGKSVRIVLFLSYCLLCSTVSNTTFCFFFYCLPCSTVSNTTFCFFFYCLLCSTVSNTTFCFFLSGNIFKYFLSTSL